MNDADVLKVIKRLMGMLDDPDKRGDIENLEDIVDDKGKLKPVPPMAAGKTLKKKYKKTVKTETSEHITKPVPPMK